MYGFWKVLAGISIVVHGILHVWSVTDFFNRAFMGVGVVILLLPRKWWPLYILPVVIMLAGLLVASYVLYAGLAHSGAVF